MAVQKGAPIVEPKGKLGVLLVGLGAVSTTFIAGVEAVKKGIGQPIGSLTQMGTVRLGKRTDNRVPLIKDFVPLARLEDLVFGAWDIFEDSAYEAAMHAGVHCRLISRVFKNVPRAKNEIFKSRQRHKVLDQRNAIVGAFAQPDRAHLRQTANGLTDALFYCFNAGNECRT